MSGDTKEQFEPRTINELLGGCNSSWSPSLKSWAVVRAGADINAKSPPLICVKDNFQTYLDQSVLEIAILRLNTEFNPANNVVRYLLSHPKLIDRSTRIRCGQNSLPNAYALEICSLIIDLLDRQKGDRTPLVRAAYKTQNWGVFGLLIDRGLNLASTEFLGSMTLLEMAVLEENVQMVQFLLSKGVFPDKGSRDASKQCKSDARGKKVLKLIMEANKSRKISLWK